MMTESYESESLKKLIADKRKYYSTLKNESAARLLQKEILFLENDILPLVLRTSTLHHSETVKYFTLCYDEAIHRNCNGLLLYVPIRNGYKERPIIGRANCRQLDSDPEGAIEIYVDKVDVLNMDGSGTDNVEIFILDIDGYDTQYART